LIDFIQQHHHRYVRESIPEIMGLLERICEKHGADQPLLRKLQQTFGLLAKELLAHLPKEEEILFPMILHFTREGTTPNDIYPRVEAPVAVMEHEHESAGDLIKLIRSLTDNYTTPDYACPTYQYTFRMLREFDEDLMQHIHLENNIVFARLKG
jgi:regulator of cell morphogenesis and NO signaling